MFSSVKRQNARIKPSPARPVEIQIMGSDSLDVLNASNISVSGIGIRVPHKFEGYNLQAEVELVVTLPGCQPFVARGVIRHISKINNPGDLFGIEFTQINDEHLNAVRNYVNHYLQLQ